MNLKTMRNVFLVLCIAVSASMYSQKVAFIESEYILSKINAYSQAKEKIENLSQKWQKESEEKMKQVEKMYNIFQSEQVLYNEKVRQEKISEIEKIESDIANLQKNRFGPNGDLYRKRQELIEPIINDMYEAAKKIAQSKSFDMIIDKSNGNSIIYTKESLNISDLVSKEMTIK